MKKQMTRIKKAHITLMKHPETALYSGVMLMGTSEVVENSRFTAYTDGVNKKYSKDFLKTISKESQLRGLVLHENLHVALKHIQRGKVMWEQNKKIANAAADYVANNIIVNIHGHISGDTGERVVELPDGGLYDAMFNNWSMKEVFNYLMKNQQEEDKDDGGNSGDNGSGDSGNDSGGNGSNSGSGGFDEHDFEGTGEITYEEAKAVEASIDKALREGGILAGRMGATVPRAISDLLLPTVDWREVLKEFVTSSTKGSEEATWRKMNKRYLANDMYIAGYETDVMGEVIVAIDTSGSIGGVELTEFATELASICEVCSPERVRVLWWDTKVHGEQIFEGDYTNIAKLLKPLGGGGTYVSCVAEYINKERIEAEACIIFTDGYVEDDVKWNITPPTLWMITQSKSFEPPIGKKVFKERT